jgi:hypothetical protein
MINAALFVRDTIGLKCTLYIVIVWNLEGLFPGEKRTHINTKPMFLLGFTISCMLDKYNSHNNRFRFLSFKSKLQHPRKHHK